jgi:hypothetical protein
VNIAGSHGRRLWSDELSEASGIKDKVRDVS